MAAKNVATTLGKWLFGSADRVKKAKDQGWKVDDTQFHWTTGDVEEFKDPTKVGKVGKAIYMSPNQQGGKRYLHRGEGKTDVYKVDKEGNEYFPEGSNVMPLLYRGELANYEDTIALARDYFQKGGKGGNAEAFDYAQQELKKQGYSGVRVNGNEIAIFDPKDVRSVNAKFDPDKSTSRNLLASSAGAGILSALAPTEEAEASVIPSAGKVMRMIQLGILDESNAGNLSQIKSASTRYDRMLKESRGFRAQEARAAENDYETTFLQMALPEGKTIDPAALQGEIFMPVKGDRTDIGILRQIGGFDIPDTNIQGGRKYAQQHQGTGEAWASNISAANAAYNKAKAVAKANDGQAPIGVHHAMDLTSANFSTAVAEPLMHMFYKNRENITKADVSKFDKMLRQGVGSTAKIRAKNAFPEWVGLDHPDAMDQLMGRNGYPNIGNNRTNFVNMMDRAKDFRDRGFPPVNEVYRAVNEDWQKGAGLGDAGGVLFKFDVDKAPYQTDSHKSYSHSIAGDYVGQLEKQVPYEVMYPSMWRELSKHTDKHGRPLPRTQQMNTGAMDQQYYQKADQEWVDTVSEFLRTPRAQALAKLGLGSGTAAATNAALASPDAPTKANAASLYNPYRAAKIEAEQLRAKQRDPLNVSLDGIDRNPAAAKDILGALGAGIEKTLPEMFYNLQMMAKPEIGLPMLLAEPMSDTISQNREKFIQRNAPDYKPTEGLKEEEATLWQLLGGLLAPL